MLVIIEKVLSLEEVTAAQRFMARGEFADGKLTAGKMAEGIKNNLELPQQSSEYEALNEIVYKCLMRHPQFQAAAIPKQTAAPIYSRYTPGMEYGFHVDNPIMGEGPFLRTDVSTTLFLSDPASYEGGELTVKTDYGEQQVKLEAGSAVVYPSASLHRVAPVTDGERLALVLWSQSMVRRADQRALLYELWQSRESLLISAPESENTQRIDHSYVNLMRMWAEV